MFSNHFTTNFSQNAAVKNFENRLIFTYLANIWPKLCGLLFSGPPCTVQKLTLTLAVTLGSGLNVVKFKFRV